MGREIMIEQANKRNRKGGKEVKGQRNGRTGGKGTVLI
jgi:hypothetical protein